MDFKEFFEVIPKLPGIRVYQFVDNFKDAKELVDFSKDKDFELQIVTFNEYVYEDIKKLKSENVKPRVIEEQKSRYNQRSILYDTVFVNIDIEKIKDLDQFLRKVYRMMKNGANIVVVGDIEKKDSIRDLLISCNYVAVNFTPLNGKKAVFIAKKMHGWERV